MIIDKFIISKLLISLTTGIIVVVSVFFIFSLLGNMGDGRNFLEIINLSILSAIQIIFYVPFLIFFIIIAIFWINIKSQNELLIVLHYVSFKKIILYLIFFIILFLAIDLKKTIVIDKIELLKLNITSRDYGDEKKLIIDEDNSAFTIIEKDEQNKIKQINLFEVENKKLIYSLYSQSISSQNNDLLLNRYYELLNNNINLIEDNKIIPEIKEFIFSKDRIINLNKKSIYKIDIKTLFNASFSFMLLICIVLIFLDKRVISYKTSYSGLFLLPIFLIFYSYLVMSINIKNFSYIFYLLAFFLLTIFTLKKLKYD